MKLVGANPDARVEGLEELPGKSNYFIGNDPKKWRTNVPHYGKVKYRDVYPGIDLIYYGNQRQLEWDFVVAPGADPNIITLAFQGTRNLEIDSQGDLIMHIADGQIRQHRPKVSQVVDGVKREIAGRYLLQRNNQVGFEVAPYDPSKPLVIDPILSYSTYFGGSGFDGTQGMAVDGAGNVYITGVTNSANFPTLNAFQTAFAGGAFDAFAIKLRPTPTGFALVYSTFIGGSDRDDGQDIAADVSGNAYVVGTTSSAANFPPSPTPSFQPAFGGGGTDGFVVELSPSGTLLYSSFLGGSNDDGAFGVAVGASGIIYVTGFTSSSSDFRITSGAYQPRLAGGSDAFLTKIDPSKVGAAGLIYSTYIGGSGFDTGFGIALTGSGIAYITGSTNSLNFPSSGAALQTAFGGGGFDAFVTGIDASKSGTDALIYSTYLGGSDFDNGRGIGVDTNGNVYVTGNTCSSDFPNTPGAFQITYRGGSCGGNLRGDIFVVKVDPTKIGRASLSYSTYLGGTGDEYPGEKVAVDAFGNAYVTGGTVSTDFPVAHPVSPSGVVVMRLSQN